MQFVRQREPDEMIILLVCFAGFSEYMVSASRFNLGDHIPVSLIFAFAVLTGPIIGIVGLLIATFLLHWTGKLLDGKSDYRMLRAAVAWSFVPIICYSVLWIPQYLILGDVLFQSRIVIYGSKAHLLIVGLNVFRLMIVIWSIVIFLNCLCEVQKFTIWKALGNCLMSAAIFWTVILFIAAVIGVTIS